MSITLSLSLFLSLSLSHTHTYTNTYIIPFFPIGSAGTLAWMDCWILPSSGNDLSTLMTSEQKPSNYYKSTMCSCWTQHVNVKKEKKAEKTKDIAQNNAWDIWVCAGLDWGSVGGGVWHWWWVRGGDIVCLCVPILQCCKECFCRSKGSLGSFASSSSSTSVFF